jgi:hypothetical protein
MMKDLIGFAAVSGALASGLGGMHFYGQIHVALFALLLLASGVLAYLGWRMLVTPKAAALAGEGKEEAR